MNFKKPQFKFFLEGVILVIIIENSKEECQCSMRLGLGCRPFLIVIHSIKPERPLQDTELKEKENKGETSKKAKSEIKNSRLDAI